MRAEHRHELKTNELAQWLMGLPEWFKKNSRIISYVTAVVIIVGGVYLYNWYQKTVASGRERNSLTALLAQTAAQEGQIARVQAEGVDASYMLLQVANELENFANGAKDDTVAALGLIKEAEILRTELHFRLGPVSEQDLANQVNRAKNSLTKALDVYLKRTPNSSLEAMAKLGMGLCEEELGNLDAARSIYKEMATNEAFDGTTSAAAAKKRLTTMDFYTQKIALKPSPKPEQPAQQVPSPSLVPQGEVTPEANTPGLN